MIISGNLNNYTNIIDYKRQNNKQYTNIQPPADSIKSPKPQLSYEQTKAMAAQRVSFKGGKELKIPHITEKDINISVTCMGHSNVKSNTRKVFDYRCLMQIRAGIYWYQNFKIPHVIHNGNLDEKINGETTALVIPLHPKSRGLRGADNMTLLLNGNIPNEILNELVLYMAKAGILNAAPLSGREYYVNSTEPNDFMSNPKIKSCIANFFKQKEIQQARETQEADKHVKTSDINIVNIDRKFDKNNTREVKDYLREFLKNDRKMTVVYDKTQKDGYTQDITAILIPSAKSNWDCITVTIDKKIPQEICKDLINYLIRTKSADAEDENFRNLIAGYLNSLQ